MGGGNSKDKDPKKEGGGTGSGGQSPTSESSAASAAVRLIESRRVFRLPESKYENWPPDVPLKLCKLLETLEAPYNYLKSIPSDIGFVKTLKILDLSYNMLERLPPEICALKALETLVVNHNLLEALPDGIGDCVNLTDLQVRNNRLKSVPSSVGSLVSLRVLNVKANCLSELPNSISNCSNLEELLAGGNSLTTFSVSLQQMRKLKKIDLDENDFKGIQGFEHVAQLTRLFLKDCELASLPESIGNLTNLQECDLSHNQLIALPESFPCLTRLTQLHLLYNRLQTLPTAMSNLSLLHCLDLRHNELASLPDFVFQMRSLKKLDVSWNRLSSLPKIKPPPATSLTSFSVNCNSIQSLPPELFSSFVALKELNLSANKLAFSGKDKSPNSSPRSSSNSSSSSGPSIEVICQLTTLEKLLLSHNQLKKLPKEFTKLASLTLLSLSANKFSTFPAACLELKNIKTLYIAANSLESIPKEIGKLTNLQFFSASANQLKEINPDFKLCRKLKELDLSHNRLNTKALAEFGALVELRELDISGNPGIDRIPGFTSIQNLNQIKACYCGAKKVSSETAYMTSLTWMPLAGNPLYIASTPEAQGNLLSPSSSSTSSSSLAPAAMTNSPSTINPVPRKILRITEVEEGSSFYPTTNAYRVSWSEFRGERPEQEDTVLIVQSFFFSSSRAQPSIPVLVPALAPSAPVTHAPSDLQRSISRKDSKSIDCDQLYGVFDGHGGRKAAEFSAAEFPRVFSWILQMNVEPAKALEATFKSLNEEFLKKKLSRVGCTALVVYITKNKKMVVANMGDARAVLCRDGQAIRVSKDHKPELKEERHRIQNIPGGFVSDDGRVIGTIGVSRAIGDLEESQYLLCEPHIWQDNIDLSKDEFIIMACDGLWDVVSDSQACEVVKKLSERGKAASVLRDLAFSCGSTDNISVVVVHFK